MVWVDGFSNEYVPRALSPSSSSTSSTDSDVRVVNDSLDTYRFYRMPSAGPHLIDMPGKLLRIVLFFSLLFSLSLSL